MTNSLVLAVLGIWVSSSVLAQSLAIKDTDSYRGIEYIDSKISGGRCSITFFSIRSHRLLSSANCFESDVVLESSVAEIAIEPKTVSTPLISAESQDCVLKDESGRSYVPFLRKRPGLVVTMNPKTRKPDSWVAQVPGYLFTTKVECRDLKLLSDWGD